MKIKDLDLAFRPRERARRYGVSNLSDIELLSLILCQGTPSVPLLELASRIIYSHSSLKELFDSSFKELIDFKGIGDAQAFKLLAVFELSKRANFIDIDLSFDFMPLVNKYMIVVSKFKEEHGYLIGLNSNHEVILEKELFKGIKGFGFIDASMIMNELNESQSKEFILIHNHLETVKPSDEDIISTLKIEEIAKTNHKKLLDHIIVTKSDFYSIKKLVNKKTII